MGKATVWSNSDGLAVGFGTRTVTTSGSSRAAQNGPTEKLNFVFRGEDLADAVSTTSDAILYAPVIPNGAVILSATLKVTETFVTASSGVLDIGLYTDAGATVDDDGIDAAVAATALTVGAEIACDGADVNTVVATTGGVKVAASYDTDDFTAGEAILEVEYATPS
jgi:hypothetical protein